MLTLDRVKAAPPYRDGKQKEKNHLHSLQISRNSGDACGFQVEMKELRRAAAPLFFTRSLGAVHARTGETAKNKEDEKFLETFIEGRGREFITKIFSPISLEHRRGVFQELEWRDRANVEERNDVFKGCREVLARAALLEGKLNIFWSVFVRNFAGSLDNLIKYGAVPLLHTENQGELQAWM